MIKQPVFKKYRLLFLLAGTLVMVVVMAKTGATLKTPATPKGILDLEFAYNASKASTVIHAWNDGSTPFNNNFAAINNTRLDFIFLFFYALFLYYSCNLTASFFNGNFHTVGIFLGRGALAAGVLDILENIGMLITLYGHISDNYSLLTFIFSITKWLLAIAAVLYIIFAGGIVMYKKIYKPG